MLMLEFNIEKQINVLRVDVGGRLVVRRNKEYKECKKI